MEVVSFEATNLLKTLMIIMLVYYGFRFIMKWLKPIIIRKGMEELNKRQQQHQQYQGGGYQKSSTGYQKGHVSVEKPATGNGKASNDPDGEYVDFEEIKD